MGCNKPAVIYIREILTGNASVSSRNLFFTMHRRLCSGSTGYAGFIINNGVTEMRSILSETGNPDYSPVVSEKSGGRLIYIKQPA